VSGDNVLRGLTALVTGASSGIGLELTEVLASKGFGLIVVGRHQKLAQ
jgi:short-subunit dehydrogenase